MDQRGFSERPDVLVYRTEPLTEDLEVTGPVTLVLHASSSARDTDFTAKLIDVFPDGKAYNICDGIVRARFRNGPVSPSLLEPGRVYRFEIRVGITSNVFLKGHRIRLDISSSNFPRFSRNLNTGGPPGEETVPAKAAQTIYHDRARPSYLVLPVVKS